MENNTDVQVTEEKVEETTQKTFTQEDLDNSFNAGRKKASKDWQKDEDYQKFVEWKKNNQSEQEKITELKTNYEKAIKENEILKARSKVSNSDVKPEFLKFVTSEVMNLVTDDVDFDKALKNYKKENSQYFGETVIKKVQSSPTLVGGSKPKTTNDIMNNLIRGGRN